MSETNGTPPQNDHAPRPAPQEERLERFPDRYVYTPAPRRRLCSDGVVRLSSDPEPYPLLRDGLLVCGKPPGLPIEIPEGWRDVEFFPLRIAREHAVAFIRQAVVRLATYDEDLAEYWQLRSHFDNVKPPPLGEYLLDAHLLGERLLALDGLPPIPCGEVDADQCARWLKALERLLLGDPPPSWLSERFKGKQCAFMKALWGRGEVPLADAHRAVYGCPSGNERALDAIKDNVNIKLCELGPEIGVFYTVHRRGRAYALDRSE